PPSDRLSSLSLHDALPIYEEFERIGEVEGAITQSRARVGPVMLAAGMIAALSFCSLATFRTASIRTFGIFTGFGILSALAIELSVIPAVRACLPAPRRRERDREAAAHPWLDAFLRASGRIASGPARRWLFAGAALVVACAALRATRTRVAMSDKRVFSAADSGRVHVAASHR